MTGQTGNGQTDGGTNKENINSNSALKIPKRRDSLGKGILKGLRRQDENQTISVMQLPLRDSQQRSVDDGGKKSYRRRVSFAPEVTLHKIDLIPQLPNVAERQPRRRETIAFAPNSSQETDVSHSSKDFEPEEIMYDSSDVEMEDDSHVYSSPGKINNPGFKIHDDNEEYTETIDMSISRILDDKSESVDDEEEDTMELTRPLGTIQQFQPHSSFTAPQSGEPIDKSSQESSSRPFGSIKSLFDFSEEIEHQESEVELIEPGSQIEISSSIPENEPNTSYDNNSSIDETMELTKLVDGSTDKLTMHNTFKNSQPTQPDYNEDITMDQTKALSSIRTVGGNVDQDLTLKEAPMDETTYYVSEKKQLTPNGITPPKQTTPLRPTRSHTSETGSPRSSKRKSFHNQSSVAVTNELRDRINSLTPKKKKRKSSDSHNDVIRNVGTSKLVEKSHSLFPSSQIYSSQDELKSSFTPLRSSKNTNRKSVIYSGKPHQEFIPLAPSHEQDDNGAEENPVEEYRPVSLKRFLSDLSIEFFDDLNINEDFTVEFKRIDHTKTLDLVNFTIAKNSKIPWLELYSFSCEELLKNMKELKQLFDDLDLEFEEENPQIVRAYYETKSIAQQKKMSDRLSLMKTYSDKEAEKSWMSWRGKLLDELEARLQINYDSLLSDSEKINDSYDKVTQLKGKLSEEHTVLKNKVEHDQSKIDAINSEETEELRLLKEELLTELEALIDEENDVEKLEEEVDEISSQAADTTALEEEIELKRAYIERNSQEPTARLNRILIEYNKLTSVVGISFESLNNTILTISLIRSDIHVSIDLTNLTKTVIRYPQQLSDTSVHLLNTYMQQFSEDNVSLFLHKLSTLAEFLIDLEREVYYLGLHFPSFTQSNDGLNLEFQVFSSKEKYKATLKLAIGQMSLYDLKLPSEIEAHLIYGPSHLKENDLLNNLKSKVSTTLFKNIEKLTFV